MFDLSSYVPKHKHLMSPDLKANGIGSSEELYDCSDRRVSFVVAAFGCWGRF